VNQHGRIGHGGVALVGQLERGRARGEISICAA
jgi:hypothetical protein